MEYKMGAEIMTQRENNSQLKKYNNTEIILERLNFLRDGDFTLLPSHLSLHTRAHTHTHTFKFLPNIVIT